MNKADKQAKADMKKEIFPFYPDMKNSFDQLNVTISHLFTKENKKLNDLILN